MEFGICTELSCAPSTTVDLPIKSWDEIKEWFVKWDTLHYTLDGDKWHEIDLNNVGSDDMNWKRPVSVRVYDPKTYETIVEEEE